MSWTQCTEPCSPSLPVGRYFPKVGNNRQVRSYPFDLSDICRGWFVSRNHCRNQNLNTSVHISIFSVRLDEFFMHQCLTYSLAYRSEKSAFRSFVIQSLLCLYSWVRVCWLYSSCYKVSHAIYKPTTLLQVYSGTCQRANILVPTKTHRRMDWANTRDSGSPQPSSSH